MTVTAVECMCCEVEFRHGTAARAIELWNRRSSPSTAPSGELGEPVKAFSETFSAVTAMKQEFAPSAVEAAEVVLRSDEARKQAGERLHADAYETASEEMDRADAAEAQLAYAREVLEQVLSVEQCPHPIGDLVNDPDPSAKKCWESGACGCVYGAGFAAIRALGGGK